MQVGSEGILKIWPVSGTGNGSENSWGTVLASKKQGAPDAMFELGKGGAGVQG